MSALAALCFLATFSYAALTPEAITEKTTQEIEASPGQSWFKNFDQQRDEFSRKYGTSFAFLFHYDQQYIISAEQNSGRGAGLCYWNLEVIQKLWKGGALTTELEVDRGKGVDKFIPSFSFFNSNSGDNIDLYLPKLYLSQGLEEDKVYLAAGKLDLSDWFDGSAVASSADTQFVTNSLVNNPVIAFPVPGIGAMFILKPYEWLYFQAGAATAKSVRTQTGLRDGFNSTFFINELGLTPKFGNLQGNYRFIFNLTRRKLDYIDESGTKNNTRGFALSFDQQLSERFTMFARYGFQNPKVNSLKHFWSAGAQLSEPLPGRKFDCLAFAVAESVTAADYREYYGSDIISKETIWELYYSYDHNHILIFTPHLQILSHPNADKTARNAIVAGVRLLVSF